MSTSVTRLDAPVVPNRRTRFARFGRCYVAYDERVLTPRPWTLAQSEWAAELVGDGAVLELCAGVGHIGLATHAITGCSLVQLDVDPLAVAYARFNAAMNASAGAVTVHVGRVELAPRLGRWFDVVIVDPPYIPSNRRDDHPEDPAHAIDGGADGLWVARRALIAAASAVHPGGTVLVQLGSCEQAHSLDAWRRATRRQSHIALVDVRVHDEGVVARFDRREGRRKPQVLNCAVAASIQNAVTASVAVPPHAPATKRLNWTVFGVVLVVALLFWFGLPFLGERLRPDTPLSTPQRYDVTQEVSIRAVTGWTPRSITQRIVVERSGVTFTAEAGEFDGDARALARREGAGDASLTTVRTADGVEGVQWTRRDDADTELMSAFVHGRDAIVTTAKGSAAAVGAQRDAIADMNESIRFATARDHGKK